MRKYPWNLNIAYVGTLPPHPGGSAIFCFQLLVGLAGLGHSVRAVAPITNEELRGGDAFANSHPEIAVTRILVPYFEISPDIPPSDEYRRQEGKQIKEALSVLIAKGRPDVIIIGRETFAWHVPDIAIDYSIPCILLIHGLILRIINHTFPETKAKELLEQYRKVNLMVAVAKHLDNILRCLGFSNFKVIQNAIDVHQFLPRPKSDKLLRKLAIQKDDIVVAHLSNLKPVKRPLDLVYSAKISIQKTPRLIYVIVGDGPMRETMEEACRQNQILDKFRFVGWVDYDRIPDYINLSDIVVMPSEAEARALVYLETQACGRLLLASDIPGAREAIINRITGLLFAKGDIEDLTAKTLLAADNPKLRADIGRKALETVQAHSLDYVVAEYVVTLEEVVRKHQS